MEEDCEVYMDPLVDEILFYDVSERGKQIKPSREAASGISDVKQKISDNYSEESNTSNKTSNSNIKKMTALTTTSRFEQISDLTLSSNDSVNSVTNQRTAANINHHYEEARKPISSAITSNSLLTSQKNSRYEKEVIRSMQEVQDATENKRDVHFEISNSKTNILLDHAYSAPIKCVIDRGILKTPKSIVKADKDGGYLKVLSEIALVKAEADENQFKDTHNLVDLSTELTNDDNKENEMYEDEFGIKAFKGTETSAILHPAPDIRKIHCNNFATETLHKSPENFTENGDDILVLYECVNTKADEVKSDVSQVNLEMEKSLKIEVKSNCKNEHPMQQDTEPVLSEEISKENLKRKTIKFLEELSLVDVFDQKKEHSHDIKLKNRFSEEAKKIIEALKTDGLDDSIISLDQYFDLDKLSNSFSTCELSDVFSDIDNNLEFKVKHEASEFEKEINEESQKNCIPLQKRSVETHIKARSCEQEIDIHATGVEKTSDKQKLQSSDSSEEIKNNSFSKQKNMIKKPTSECQIGLKVCHSDRNTRTGGFTRIPKLISSTSKIPIYSQEIKAQNEKAVVNSPLLYKAQKSLKFNNIESPVQAYIKSRAPVLISNIKAKSEPPFNIWKKHVDNPARVANIENEMKKKCESGKGKSDLPFVEYKSAVPLKFEKLPESRLPRLAPKMKKLLGNLSPVIAKHEGRIQLSVPRKLQTGADESSVLNANEVSVLISRVAQKNKH